MWIQYNAMHKFARVVDNPRFAVLIVFSNASCVVEVILNPTCTVCSVCVYLLTVFSEMKLSAVLWFLVCTPHIELK